MKVKITLLLYTNSTNFDNKLFLHEFKCEKPLANPYQKSLTFNYEITESNSTVFFLKLAISQLFKIKVDFICLLNHNEKQEQFQIVKDTSNIFAFFQSNSLKQPSIEFYYKIVNIPIKLKIDFYRNQIDSINLTLSSVASIYLIKYLLNQKINNNIAVNAQKIYFLRLISSSDNSTIENNNENSPQLSKEYSNEITINDIIVTYLKGSNSLNEPITKYKLHLLLVTEEENRKLNFGLNFNFNFFKNMNKISFQQNAPSYRECSDGLNVFCYCKNEQCQIYNELFVINFGYGPFNLIDKILTSVQCPICKYNFIKVQVRNIGFINAKWTYRGKMNNRNQSSFNGEGSTLDDKLYVLKEINFELCFKNFEVNVTEYFKKTPQEESINKSNGSSLSSNLDNIDLVIIHKEEKKDHKTDLKSFLNYKNNINSAQVRSESTDIFELFSKKTSFCGRINEKLTNKDINVNIEKDDGKCCTGTCISKNSNETGLTKSENNSTCCIL